MKVIGLIYVFVFACLFTAQAVNPKTKKIQNPTNQQAQTKDCVKHPVIVKTNTVTARQQEKPKVNVAVKAAPLNKSSNTVPHFSVLNFINFFYTKDSLDNLQVM